MAEKFTTNLLRYTSTDVVTLNSAFDALNLGTEDEHAGGSRVELLEALENGVGQLKGKPVPGMAHSEGWIPLIKMLRKVIDQEQNSEELRKRALNVLLELVGMSTARAMQTQGAELAELALDVLDEGGEKKDEKKPLSAELRLVALRVLNAIFDKFPKELPTGLSEIFPRLQPALLAVLPDKSDPEARELANKCMSAVIAFHSDPNSVFSVLSEMSDDCELMLKDDPLLDDLIEKCWARDNELQGR